MHITMNDMTTGYPCPQCGGLISSYQFHQCPTPVYPILTYVPTVTYVNTIPSDLSEKLDRLTRILKGVAEGLETLIDLSLKEYEEVCRRDSEGCEDQAPDAPGSGAVEELVAFKKTVRKLGL